MTEPNNDEWLQLTEEDLARAQRLTAAAMPAPGVIRITEADIAAPDETTSDRPVTPPALTITLGDLTVEPPAVSASERIRELERLSLTLLNQARAQHLPGWLGSTQLREHPGLAAVARGHSNDMLKRQYVDHVSPEGKTAAQRITAYHIRYIACGENIGIVYGENSHTDQAVHDIHNAYMNQPRGLTNHRGNLLNPIWTHVGIGIAYNPDGSLVMTQNFISAPGKK